MIIRTFLEMFISEFRLVEPSFSSRSLPKMRKSYNHINKVLHKNVRNNKDKEIYQKD